jgi:hypothetical protein
MGGLRSNHRENVAGLPVAAPRIAVDSDGATSALSCPRSLNVSATPSTSAKLVIKYMKLHLIAQGWTPPGRGEARKSNFTPAMPPGWLAKMVSGVALFEEA